MEATGASDCKIRSFSKSRAKPPRPLRTASLRLGGWLAVAEVARGDPRLHLVLALSWFTCPFHETKAKAKQKAREGMELISNFHINLRSSWVPVRAVSTSYPIFLCLNSSQWGRRQLYKDLKFSRGLSNRSPEGLALPLIRKDREFCYLPF